MTAPDDNAGAQPEIATTPSGFPDDGRNGAPRARLWARLLFIAAALVLVGALSVAGVRWLQAADRVREARASIEDAALMLGAAEDDLIVVDDAVQADISSEIATTSAEARDLASKVGTDVARVADILSEAIPDLPPEDVPLAEALLASAEARAEMMTEAPVILEADRMAATVIPLADQALAEITAAEQLAGQATAEFNKHTKAGVQAADATIVQMEARLAAARSALTSAAAEFPGVDYSAFIAYIDAKSALVGIAKEIDALWLAGKIAESNQRLDAYNKKDAEVVAMAKALPASIRDPIADAYQTATADAVQRYFDARERARAAGERVSGERGSVGADE